MKNLIAILFIVLAASLTRAEVHIPDVIGSWMVLQQKQAVPIWGTADPGEAVIVTFAGQRKTEVAGPDGKWRVNLDKLSASFKPQVMTISGRNKIELSDILVGEVW